MTDPRSPPSARQVPPGEPPGPSRRLDRTVLLGREERRPDEEGARSSSSFPAALALPLVRAKHLQLWLDCVERLEAPLRERFYGLLPEGFTTRVADAPALSWLPIRDDVLLAEVTRGALGHARAYRFYNDFLAASMSASLLGPLVSTGVRLLGLEPATFVKWWPKGWDAVFRNVGKITSNLEGPSRGHIVHEDVPPDCALSPAWVESLQASAEVIYTLTKREGVVRCDASGALRGRLVYTLEW